MMRSLIHLELCFVQHDKYGSICTVLYATVQFDVNHLLKMFSFSSVYFWPLYKNQVSIGVWICLGLQCVPLISVSVSVPIPCIFITVTLVYLAVGCGDTFCSYFIIQDCFNCPEFSLGRQFSF